MKKADVKSGVLYGYAKGTSEYRNAIPMIVLDASTLWTWHRSSGRENRQWKVSGEKRFTPQNYSSSYRGGSGYLVVFSYLRGTEEEQAQTLITMGELYAEFAAMAGNPDAVNALARKIGETQGIHIDVVNNRWILGDYEEAKNAQDERQKERDAERKAERNRSASEQEFMNEAAEIISAKLEKRVDLIRDYSWDGKRASISFNDLAAFLGIKTPTERL